MVGLAIILIACFIGAIAIGLMRYSFRADRFGILYLVSGFLLGLVAWYVLVTFPSLPIGYMTPLLVSFYVGLVLQWLVVERLVWFRSLMAAIQAQAPIDAVLEASLYHISPFDRGSVRRALKQLQAGGSVEEALQQLPLPLGFRLAAAAQLLAAGGTSVQRYKQLMEREQSLIDASIRRGGHWLYVAVPAATLAVLGSLYLIFLTPILDEISQELPREGAAVSAMENVYLSHGVGTMAQVVLPWCFLFAIGAGVVGLLHISGFSLAFPWSNSKRLWSARMLPFLADAIESRQPLSQAVEQVRRWHLPLAAQQWWTVVGDAESQGQHWYEELTQKRYLSKKHHDLLAAAVSAGNLPWAIDAVCDRLVDEWSRKYHRHNSIWFPLMLVGLGALIAQFPISLFVWLSYAIVHS